MGELIEGFCRDSCGCCNKAQTGGLSSKHLEPTVFTDFFLLQGES